MGGFRSPRDHLKRVVESQSLQLCLRRVLLGQGGFSKVTPERDMGENEGWRKQQPSKGWAGM